MKPRIKINPRTGLPYHVYRNGKNFRFMISVNGVPYRSINYSNPYEAAARVHTSDVHLAPKGLGWPVPIESLR